ncbi:MAG: hypothetical protein QOF89_5056 [Acidobacteriota bacterium]|jgi:hypothetical protein|nr:hypothetical protein [Acidobacteriota bacterium]
MSGVCAEQMIYTWVKAAFSPARYDGLQTAWKSERLSAESVREIERHIQCFRPSRQGNQRLQFFLLRDGTAVVASAKAVRSLPQMTGAHRDGLFAVHCLALGREDFSRCGNDPFRVLDAGRFLDDLQAMIDAFGLGTGRAPRVEIALRDPGLLRARWYGEAAWNLLRLGFQAPALRDRGSMVLLIGEQQEIEEALRVVFRLMPAERRLSCSFDTAVEDVRLEPGALWAAGARSYLPGQRFIAVDVMARRVPGSLGPLATDDGFYEEQIGRWLRQGLPLESVAKRAAVTDAHRKTGVTRTEDPHD